MKFTVFSVNLLSLTAVTMPVMSKYKRNIIIFTVTRIEGFNKTYTTESVTNTHTKRAHIIQDAQ